MNNDIGFHCNTLQHIQSRLLANGLKRGEFYNLPSGDIEDLWRLVQQHNLTMSVHTPLVRTPWYPDPPTWAFLCDPEADKRLLNFRLIEETLRQVQGWKVEHLIVHFPTPPTSNSVGPDVLQRVVEESVLKLAQLSRQYGVTIHVEGFGPSPFLSVDFLKRTLAGLPELRYCFDTGHMNLAAKRDGLDIYSFAQEMAPYIGSMHLWNTRSFDDYLTYRHIPIHPSQKPEQGWADIARLVKIIRSQNESCVITFESSERYPVELGGYDYRDGIAWLKQLLTISS